ILGANGQLASRCPAKPRHRRAPPRVFHRPWKDLDPCPLRYPGLGNVRKWAEIGDRARRPADHQASGEAFEGVPAGGGDVRGGARRQVARPDLDCEAGLQQPDTARKAGDSAAYDENIHGNIPGPITNRSYSGGRFGGLCPPKNPLLFPPTCGGKAAPSGGKRRSSGAPSPRPPPNTPTTQHPGKT